MASRIIISGIPPGKSGVGRVIEYLIGNSSGIKFTHPPKAREKSIKNSLLSFEFTGLILSILESFTYKYQKLIFNIKINATSKKEIILIHPQSLGFNRVIKLLEKNNASLYVMDNSFFCIKSYNYLDNTQKACLLCLGVDFINAKNNDCKAFPIPYTYEEYFRFVSYLKEHYEKVRFIVQNVGQLELLKMQFGADLNYKIIGLLTSDLFEDESKNSDKNEISYDFVFHGDHTPAKGSSYVLSLASYLPNYTFLFPFDKSGSCNNLPNVTFKTMNWSNGLRDAISSSKLTFAPSIWAAPIEGSVMKTLKLGVPLAVYNVEGSFAAEIPDNAVIKLTGNINNDVILIKNFIVTNQYPQFSNNGKKFANQKIVEMKKSYFNEFMIK